MVEISGWSSCENVIDESDEWIPMSISWDVEVSGRLLYLRISGKTGGEIEIKVSALTGSIHSFIVLEWPPESSKDCASAPETTIASAVPNIKMDIWGPAPLDLFRVRPVFISAQLEMHRTRDEITVIIGCDTEITTSIECEFLSVGISRSGELISFTKSNKPERG
ncbi:hypothetical protein [Nocardia asteroides]|uniref:hypothetical protein n=1 Tax=Nocardia asteroides TaxID=1824 RepID=UPI0033DE7E71